MSKRREWAFPFTVAALIGACEKRLTYHEERIAFWTGEEATADADLRSKGIELREFQVTGGARTDIVLDPTRERRLSECRAKLRHHRTEANGYRAYLVGLALADASTSYEADADDIVWLGLADNDGESDEA